MTEAEARELLGCELEKFVDDEAPYYWIRELISERDTGFLFQAAIYQAGEDPAKKWHPWSVDAKSKNVEFMIM